MIDLKHVGEMLVISGTTKPSGDGLSAQEVVALMQENLRSTGIFSDIYLNWGDPNNFGHYEFSFTSKIVQPYRIHNYPIELDFGAWTLRERLYKPDLKPGETENTDELASASSVEEIPEMTQPIKVASGTPEPISEVAIELPSDAITNTPIARIKPSRPKSRIPRRATPRGLDSPLGIDDRPLGGISPAGRNIPEPILPGQIDVLTLEEVNEAVSRVATALQRGHPDAETEARLKDEFKLLWSRKRTLQ